MMLIATRASQNQFDVLVFDDAYLSKIKKIVEEIDGDFKNVEQKIKVINIRPNETVS